MTTPIRAFLIVRNGPDDWTVSVCRDWEAVLASWRGRADTTQAAALHIGFDRPGPVEFEELARDRPGRLLVTAAAKFGLPKYFEASDAPIGFVRNIPIHLGTLGWGYLLEERELQSAIALSKGSGVEAASGWVADFRDENPDLVEAMNHARVFDETTYLTAEGTLPVDARRRLGVYRYVTLVGDDSDDPCAIARSAPPWLADRAVTTMDVSVRIANVCARERIVTVADLAKFDLRQLLRMPHFGRKSVLDLRESLLGALDVGPVVDFIGAGGTREGSVGAELDQMVAVFEGRFRAIFARRLGLRSPQESLRAIGDDYGLTRERIRQMEAQVLKRLRKLHWGSRFTERLKALLVGRDFPLPVLGLEAVDGWFVGVSSRPESLRYLLDSLSDGVLGIVAIDSVDYVGAINQAEWETALSEARGMLKAGCGEGWTERHCRSVINPLIGEVAKEFRALLWEKATGLCHFAGIEKGTDVLVAYGGGADQSIEAVLLDSDHPLHYTEIAKRASNRQGRPIGVKRAHSAASVFGIRLAPGTFGLEKHLELGPGDADLIREEAEAIVLSGPVGRQWHTTEISSALLECNLPVRAPDKYLVDFLLRRSKVLRRLGRMTWVESRSGALEAAARIDIRQAILALVETAGRPLTSAEIRQRLVALRGVNETFQVVAVEPLIRLGPALWGLNDRDLLIKRADQSTLNEELVEVLRRRGRGIHVTEIGQVAAAAVARWPGLNPGVIFSVAGLDGRLRISGGQYLYLEAWGTPRRLTLGEAIKGVLRDAAGPLAFEEIATLAKKRVQREPGNPAVSTYLQTIGALFDPTSRTWVLPEGELDERDDEDSGVESGVVGDNADLGES